MPALVNIAFAGGGGAMRLLTNAEGDVFIADLGGSMKENSAKSQRPSATNAKRDVFFADPGVGFDDRQQHQMQVSFCNQHQEVFFRRPWTWF